LRPKVRTGETVDEDRNPFETKPLHLMADEDREFPIGSLNDWEVKVLERETGHSDLLAWYRNPGRASADSLAVASKNGKGAWRRLCPDFLFFTGHDSAVRTSIIDPHGFHLGDALRTLRGVADLTEQFGDVVPQSRVSGEDAGSKAASS
jgi:type III restriction enzyme